MLFGCYQHLFSLRGIRGIRVALTFKLNAALNVREEG